jgi:phage baseplate assembly protein W
MGDFLGIGWSTARHIEAEGGTDGKGAIALSRFDDNIRESIITILRTTLGERQMRPDFGCDIQTLVFASNDATTAGRAAFFVERALKRWEPRIEILRVEAEPDVTTRNRIVVEIEYQVIATNTIFNLVYPFYLTEGVGA